MTALLCRRWVFPGLRGQGPCWLGWGLLPRAPLRGAGAGAGRAAVRLPFLLRHHGNNGDLAGRRRGRALEEAAQVWRPAGDPQGPEVGAAASGWLGSSSLATEPASLRGEWALDVL